MSTRCQVKITEYGVKNSKEAITLYHHCDGYPTGMVPLIAAAYKPEWKHGRVGKAVSFVVAEDPDGYEIEQGHELHGDIEWYYVLAVKSETHAAAIPEWFLTVYKCDVKPSRISRRFIAVRLIRQLPWLNRWKILRTNNVHN